MRPYPIEIHAERSLVAVYFHSVPYTQWIVENHAKPVMLDIGYRWAHWPLLF